MRNSLSIRIDASEKYGVRLWLAVDGQELFQLGAECLEESILGSRDAVDHAVRLKFYQDSPSERVVDYGFCVEECCPSTLVTVSTEGELVRWHGLRHTAELNGR